MNREDIIRMAREASNTPIDHHATPDLFGVSQIERFAALVAAAAIKDAPDYKMGYADGVADEREACAKVAEQHPAYDWAPAVCEIAYAIRARGQA